MCFSHYWPDILETYNYFRRTQPNPSKIEAIVKMLISNNREELKRFLSTSNYLCKFISNYFKTTSPLGTLLQSDIEWSFWKFCNVKYMLKVDHNLFSCLVNSIALWGKYEFIFFGKNSVFLATAMFFLIFLQPFFENEAEFFIFGGYSSVEK